jgi:hypothetical protein
VLHWLAGVEVDAHGLAVVAGLVVQVAGGERGTVFQQGPVLFVVAGVVAQEAAAGQLAYLLLDELLFVEAVAQALLQQGGVQAQGLEHVVRGQPVLAVGEGRVGFDQVPVLIR